MQGLQIMAKTLIKLSASTNLLAKFWSQKAIIRNDTTRILGLEQNPQFLHWNMYQLSHLQ